MKLPTLAGRLRETSALVALSAAAIVGFATPSAAQITQGIFGGGSTLASEALRQLFDCYMGRTVGGDGFTFTSSSTLKAGQLPGTCSTTTQATSVQGMYAAVGSGQGTAAYITNDPKQLMSSNSGSTLPFPNSQPPFVDSSNSTHFGTYPYPRIDFGAGDSPLPGNGTSTLGNLTANSFTGIKPTPPWIVLPTTTTKTVTFASTEAIWYGPATTATLATTATWGAPIQIPLFEAPVALAIDTTNPTGHTWDIKSGNATTTAAGGAIALSLAEVCAIYSGNVTDWGSGNKIPAIVSATASTYTLGTQLFYADNVAVGSTTPGVSFVTGGPFTTPAIPITIVFRSDGSGTSFIIQNMLHNACPLLDPTNAFGYKSIFAALVPSTRFGLDSSGHNTGLKALVSSYWHTKNGTDPTTTWLGETGSAGVASTVGTSAAAAGRLGYVSADFTEPYATTVKGAPAPHSASVQNIEQISVGILHPTTKFIAPTPTSADGAFASLGVVAPNNTWAAWDLYAQAYKPTQKVGPIPVGNLSVLGIPIFSTAYPISGTTFAYVYSCYDNTASANEVANFLAWLLGGGITTLPAYTNANNRTNPGFDKNVGAILANNSFHTLHSTLATNLLTEYVKPSAHGGTTRAISDVMTNKDGCTGVKGGAH
jgi:ABC-type phosphate transport system substrate-binding protein